MLDRRKNLENLLEQAKAERCALDVEIMAYVEALKKWDAGTPTLADLRQIAKERVSGTNEQANDRKTRNGKLTHYERVVDFFVQRQNTPATVRDVADGVGEKLTSITNVMQHTHKDKFVRHEIQGFSRKSKFTLKSEIYEQHRK